MSRTDVLNIAQSYAFDLAGTAELEAYYDDLMVDAGRWGISTECRLLPTTRGDAEYAFPVDSVREYAIFYDDIMLSRMELRDLEASFGPLWRQRSGRPAAYVMQDMPEHEVRIAPAPDAASVDFSFIFGAPVGHDFPARSLGVVLSVTRQDLPAWLDVPLALSLLSREYERESAHRDVAFAAASRAMATQLLALVLGAG